MSNPLDARIVFKLRDDNKEEFERIKYTNKDLIRVLGDCYITRSNTPLFRDDTIEKDNLLSKQKPNVLRMPDPKDNMYWY